MKRVFILMIGFLFMSSLFVFADESKKIPANKVFTNQNWEKFDFSGMDLRGAKFLNTKLDRANFSNANLTGADFTNADAENCNFSNANLTSVNFIYADLEDSNLTGANIKDAIFKNTELEYTIWIDGKTCAEGSIGGCW